MASDADKSRAITERALEAKQRSILLAVRAAITNAAISGQTSVIVEYDLSGSAGDQLEEEGFTITENSGLYEVDWTP